MYLRFAPVALFCFLSSFISSQTLNTVLLDQWNPGVTGIYNDVWGYEAADGSEYVIAGSSTQVHLLSISAIGELSELFKHTPGSSSSWRDFKTYGNYAYGVADRGTEGLLIYDLSTLPTSASFVKQVTTDFVRAHNIYIDEANARLYAAGSNTVRLGLIVYDISDPENPSLIGTPLLDEMHGGPSSSFSGGYVHDLFVRDNIAYCSQARGGYYVWDFTNAAAPTVIGSINNETGYNHSSWVTEDGNTAFYAEETSGRPLTVLDISDPTDFNVIETIKEPLLAPTHTNNIAHNPFLKDGYLYVSYYEDGVQIWDVRDLDNIQKVAYYDTAPTNTDYNGTERNWGTYPFFKDNKFVATDTDNGVFLAQLTGSALPLDFIDFELVKKKDFVSLIWETYGEYNVSHFEIERSRDGITFEVIGRHNPADANMGIRTYAFQDDRPFTGINYYRIKSIDVDGKSTSTKILSLINTTNNQIKIFPNPSSGTFSIQHNSIDLSSQYHARIMDYAGKVVIEHITPSIDSNRLTFDADLSSGNYSIEIFKNQILTWTDQLIITD